jgi:hypothetical protein
MAWVSPDASHRAESREERKKWFLAGIGTVLLAAFTAIASGLGGKAVEWITTTEPVLLTYSADEQFYECGSMTYLPTAKAVVALRRDWPRDWEAFNTQPGGTLAESDVIQVSIQGESDRKITLTGIAFDVTRRQRRDGAVFSAACGGPLTGRGVRVNLETSPPQVLSSSNSPDGLLPVSGGEGPRASQLSFPWTVSLTDPLLLYVVADARSCDCIWKARIPWVSGAEKGTIEIDNEGRGYRVVGGEGLAAYAPDTGGWRMWRQPGEPLPY